MLNTYPSRGDLAPACLLSPEEAVAVRDELSLEDFHALRPAAQEAVLASGPRTFAVVLVELPRGPGLRGVRGPAFADRRVA